MEKIKNYIINIVTIVNFLTIYSYVSYYYLSLATNVSIYHGNYNEYRHISISLIMFLITRKISNKFLLKINLVSLALAVSDLIIQYYIL